MKFCTEGSKASGHYSPAVISRGMVYVSGQTSADPETGKPAEGGVGAETAMALKKVEKVLKAAGCAKENIVACNVFTVAAEDWAEVNKAYGAFFGDHKPARTIAPIRELNHGCRVEINVIAELPD